MASCQTTQWGNSSPYIKLTVTETASTATTATLTYKLEYIASYAADTSYKKTYAVKIAGSEVASGSFDIDGKTGTHTITSGTKVITKNKSTQSVAFSLSFDYNGKWSGIQKNTLTASGSISVAAKTSYTISYNANGGTGAPGSQTKWHGENLTISSTKPSRAGYTFNGWALSQADANAGSWYYTPGSTCGKNENLTLYAVWSASSYTISYNANGGSGAPSSQTKAQGATVKISSTEPTRSGYIFKGWSNAASSSTVIYRPGDSYTTNASITLYAVWVIAPTEPDITNFTVERCNSDGTLNENGKYAKVQFDYLFGTTGDDILFGINAYEFGNSTKYTSTSDWLEDTSGSITRILGSETTLFDTEKRYTIKVILAVSNNSILRTEATLILEEAAYSLEFMPNNAGVRLPKDVHGNVFGLAGLPEITSNANFNNYTSTGVWGVKTNAIAATIDNIPIDQAGRLLVAHAIGGQAADSEFDYLTQTYIPYLVKYPIFERHIRKTSESTWIYSPWVVITRNRHSMISAWTGSNITKTAYDETQIPLTGSTVVGNGLTISNNAIVIGQYISAVEVSAAALIQHLSKTTEKAINLNIKKNGSTVAQSMNSAWSTEDSNFQLNVSPKLISVAEDDLITLWWQADTNDKLSAVNSRTYITVKEF